ncbi:MAG: hypothetical protein WBD27_17250 [Pyrinomonadaceae bacterium]
MRDHFTINENPKIRFGRNILSKGDCLTVQIQNGIKPRTLSFSIKKMEENDDSKEVFCSRSTSRETATGVYILKTNTLLEGMYEISVSDNDYYFSKNHFFSVIEDREQLKEAYSEMSGENDLSLSFEYLSYLQVKSLFEDWNIPFDKSIYDKENDKETQQAFLSVGIKEILTTILNENEDIITDVSLSSDIQDDKVRISFDVEKFLWMLDCFSIVLSDFVNIQKSFLFTIFFNNNRLEIRMEENGTIFDSVYNIWDENRLISNDDLLNAITQNIVENPLTEVLMEKYGEALNISSSAPGKIGISLLAGEAEKEKTMSASY